MPVNKEQVRDALAWCRGGRVSAMKYLRQQGAAFTSADFLKLCDEVEDDELEQHEETGPIIGGILEAPDKRRERTTAKTLVFTCAQSNTYLNENFFDALLVYCKHRGAELHISRFTYNKQSHGKKSIKPGSEKASDDDDLWFDPRITPYISDEALQVTDDLVWCGELNIIPTRVDPLSTFKTYTRHASGIIPHVKMRMESIPTMKHEEARFLYTTGAVTLRNYIQRSAGQVADFHHVYGAVVVEIDEDGTWWARQLNADKNGDFFDLTTHYSSKNAEDGVCVEAITHGDIHMHKLDTEIANVVWGHNGVVDTLRPAEQHFHDTVDFTPRNHHNIKDPHFLHEMHVAGTANVKAEFQDAAWFLSRQAWREWSQSYIIVSNHDRAINHWLVNPSAALDPVNAGFWHTLNAHCYAMREAKQVPHPFEYTLSSLIPNDKRSWFTFIKEDESHKVLGEIEIGLHGHLGPNGARGNPKNLRTAGKANTAHTHSAGIIEGVYTAGVYGRLDMGYNKGLSSWSHSMIVTYKNAKRAILTIKKGKAWR